MRLWLVAALALMRIEAAQKFPFAVRQESEVIADIEMSSPGSDWAKPGREAALAVLTVDRKSSQHVMLFAGAATHTYSVFLGSLRDGRHELAIELSGKYSAHGSGLVIHRVSFREVSTGDPQWNAMAHAPILYARADTIGQFNDVPLISYCEQLTENGRRLLQYTTIFSNEDGGTSTRALMARWGRTTDIEYIYRAWLDGASAVESATIQEKDHKEVPFGGRREGAHPVLIPSTRNNMVSDHGTSPIRYQIAPVVVDLTGHSREQVMDGAPFSYRVMAQELEREAKLRPFGQVDGEKISDPRNYLYVEAKVRNEQSALAVLVRLQGESEWRSSHLGRADYAISRSEWFRTTVELPPGTKAAQIAEFGFRCLVKDEKTTGGVCHLEAVSKIFFIDEDYLPGPKVWELRASENIRTGDVAVHPHE
jgi:hypothetical protein